MNTRGTARLENKLDEILSGPVWRIYQDGRKQTAFLNERSVELWLLRRSASLDVLIARDVPDRRCAVGYRTVKRYTRDAWLAEHGLNLDGK